MLDNEHLAPFLSALGNLNCLLLKNRLESSKGNMRRLVRGIQTRGLPPFGLFNVRMMQVESEIAEFARIVASQRPRAICEIGTAQGGTLLLWCTLATPDAKIVSIDKPGGPFGGGYRKFRTKFYKSFAYESQRILLLRADSHSLDTFERVRKFLGNNELDVLFIDGDHTYEGVEADFEMYSRLVRGLIAFHDIVPTTNRLVGVPQFWREISRTYNTFRIVENENQQGAGIGVLRITKPRR